MNIFGEGVNRFDDKSPSDGTDVISFPLKLNHHGHSQCKPAPML